MINKIDLLKLGNSEYLRFITEAQRIIHTYQQHIDLQSDAQIGTLSILVAEMQILYRNDPSPLSVDLAGYDTKRDRLITGLIKLCDAHTYGPDPDKRAAADLLSHNLDTYGAGIAQQSYLAETTTISNILAEWSRNPELTAAAALIGAEEWITALHAANESFNTMYLRHTTETASGAHPDTFKAKRLETDEAWYKLRDRLNSFLIINDGATSWGNMNGALNTLIDQFNATINTGIGRAATDSMAAERRKPKGFIL